MKKITSLLVSVLLALVMVLPARADIAVDEPVGGSALPFLFIGILIIAAAIILFAVIRKKK